MLRQKRETHVNSAASQSTLRQMRAHFTSRPTLTALTGVSAILAVAGPFGTDDLMRLVPRFAYWLALVIMTYAVGYLANETTWSRFGRHGQRTLDICLAILLTGAGVTCVLLALNFAVFGFFPDRDGLVSTLTTTFAIAGIVTLMLRFASAQHKTNTSATNTPPALLDRLPFDKRGRLIALSVEDHYVHVRTEKGAEMILMRLADAIREAAPVPGLQVHRSHWVALDAVRSAHKEGDRAVLTMTQGDDIPVSRANVPAIKEAGLLPR
ncbi:MAG: LytTR family transcriptional regulator [Boseongicola sp.]|nr:LytTR family transcriptional regulator [Boseongicola sp.]